jgi:hypothetical protein
VMDRSVPHFSVMGETSPELGVGYQNALKIRSVMYFTCKVLLNLGAF